MNNKTNLIEEYVNFVDNTKKQNNFFLNNFIFNCICYSFVFNFCFF